MVVTGVAPVFAPLVGGQALTLTSWRGIFALLAAIGIPLFVVTLRRVPETLAPRASPWRRPGGDARQLPPARADRNFMPYAASFSLSFAAMFAYIAGSSFVFENVYGASPQLFSLVFAVNSAGLIAASQLGARRVATVGAASLLRLGLLGVALASIATLVVTVTHAGVGPLLAALFVLMVCNGLVLPNGVAAAMAKQPRALGSASALLGLGQFGCGAVVAPLVGLGGPHDAVPMAVVIAICGLSALAINRIFAPSALSARRRPRA